MIFDFLYDRCSGFFFCVLGLITGDSRCATGTLIGGMPLIKTKKALKVFDFLYQWRSLRCEPHDWQPLL